METRQAGLTGHVTVVTRVSRRAGIGFAIASHLAALKADLFVHSFAPRGISVNTINPGAADTRCATQEQRQAIIAVEHSGRWGRPEDAARLIGWQPTIPAG